MKPIRPATYGSVVHGWPLRDHCFDKSVLVHGSHFGALIEEGVFVVKSNDWLCLSSQPKLAFELCGNFITQVEHQ